jgi:hypothetical protein
MSASVKEDKQDWTSDIVWVGLYSILVFPLMVVWTDIPA